MKVFNNNKEYGLFLLGENLTQLATRTANSGNYYYVSCWEVFDTNSTSKRYLVLARWNSGTDVKVAMSIMQYNGVGVFAYSNILTNSNGIASNGYSVGVNETGSNGSYNVGVSNIQFYSIPLD